MPNAHHEFVNALLAGNWDLASLQQRVHQATARKPNALTPILTAVLQHFPQPPHADRLLKYLNQHHQLVEVWFENNLTIVQPFPRVVDRMAPHAKAIGWPVPSITTDDQLAATLQLDAYQLDWLCDVGGRNPAGDGSKLGHYRHRWIAKRDGGVRLLEVPKPMLRLIQRRLLRRILDVIPTHAAAHAFRRGRSIRTNADQHAGRRIVMRFDLQEFFPSIHTAAVHNLFRLAGYPRDIARRLTSLCTTTLPRSVWDARPNPASDGRDHVAWQRWHSAHLAQGAPTSPAIANLVAYSLDCRLTGWASCIGATYTRYADDLTFSGGDDLAAMSRKFADGVEHIVRDEGFVVNPAKSHVMKQSVRQIVTGVVVNVRPNRPRAEFDELKAILTNCLRHGVASQNREGHPRFCEQIQGRLAQLAMLNPSRAAKLYAIFNRIVW